MALTDVLLEAGIDVVVMAGFGTVLAQAVHDAYPGPDPQHPPGPVAGIPRLARRGARPWPPG